MREYCGIDLHSTNCWVVILDETFKVVREVKVNNDLEGVLAVLEGHRDVLEGVAVDRYWSNLRT